MSSTLSAYGFLHISTWIQLAAITRFRTDQGQAQEALLAYMNTKGTGIIDFQIPLTIEMYRELVEDENNKLRPITISTFLLTLHPDDWDNGVLDISGTFWPNIHKFNIQTGTDAHRDEEHVIIRVDDFRLFW
jgi:hypothetical protein